MENAFGYSGAALAPGEVGRSLGMRAQFQFGSLNEVRFRLTSHGPVCDWQIHLFLVIIWPHTRPFTKLRPP